MKTSMRSMRAFRPLRSKGAKVATALSGLLMAGSMSTGVATAATAMTPVTIAGAAVANGVDAPIAYCKFSGICAKYGIDLKIVYPPSGGTVSDGQLILNNTYQMAAISGYAMFQEYEAGSKLIAVANSYSKSLLGLSVRNEGSDASIKTPAQLKGKTIAETTGGATTSVLNVFLEHYGLQPSEYKVDTMDLAALGDAFTLGKVDAAIVYPMDTSPGFNAKGVKTRNFYFSTLPQLTFLYDAWAMSPKWVASHEQATKNLVNALEASTAGAVKHPAQAAADLVKSAPPHTTEGVAVTLAQWKGNVPFLKSKADAGHPYTYMAASDWTAALKYAEKYLKVKPMAISKVYTNSYVPSP